MGGAVDDMPPVDGASMPMGGEEMAHEEEPMMGGAPEDNMGGDHSMEGAPEDMPDDGGDGAEDMGPDEPQTEGEDSSELDDLMQDLEGLTPEQQKRVANYADSMKESKRTFKHRVDEFFNRLQDMDRKRNRNDIKEITNDDISDDSPFIIKR